MKRIKMLNRLVVLMALALLTLIPTASSMAQTGGGYDLTWSTIDGGGYMFSTGGSFSLGGTAGQPDAGALSGGSYSLAGGFWIGEGAAQYKIYLPLTLKNA